MTDRPFPPLLRLLRYARRYRRRFVLASACSVLNKVFDLAPPLLIGLAVDVVVQREHSFLAGWGIEDVGVQLWVLAGLTLLIWGLESAFEYTYALLWRNLAQTIQHELRLDAYAHVQTLEMGFFEDRSTGGLLAILGEDVNQLERFLDGGANDLLQVGTTVLVIGAAFFLIAPSVAWMAMLPMPFVLWGSFRFQRRIAPRYADVRERAGLLYGQLANNVGGIATIKSFTAEDREVERIRRDSEAYRVSNRGAIRLSSAFSPLIRMIIVLGFTLTLVFGGRLVLEGRLAEGLYAVMVFLTQRLLWPLTRLGATFDLYQRAMASTNRILDLLDRAPRISGGTQGLARADVRGEVAFARVQFGYHGDLPVLHDLDLRMEAGQTTALVGPTGSGKSTVIKLLLRFYDPDGGRILLDGHDVTALTLPDLRGAIGLVSQDVFLFPGTVHENIAYGRPDATRDEVVQAARVAEADEFVRHLPLGYDTVVGERGQKLSGGQRQRLSIARALLEDPPILVLDEATSSVDNETEAAIQRSLERIAHDRTVIVIAHRLSTVRNADRIYVLEAGRLVAQGRHEDLLAEGGLYAALWRVQTGLVTESAT
ncbi:MAG: ABC transporter ATP-binding protein [Planctomycetota bacterium]|jgi:ATP-binding cassette subfamily B protein